jgi:hypothetical protein
VKQRTFARSVERGEELTGPCIARFMFLVDIAQEIDSFPLGVSDVEIIRKVAEEDVEFAEECEPLGTISRVVDWVGWFRLFDLRR